MRVRVWISGADGPSHDFELVEAPRVGERIVISVGADTEEGVVSAVSWQLQAIEPPGASLSLVAEPAGSVTMVHVICRAATLERRHSSESAAIDLGESHSTSH
ncbi:hypothetical protein [Phenylobacterium sp.]|uniref:hypothetical protein n=1 Tax=Phenylobacterium sp. TaxID=1871053 RepID=UPI0037832EFE